MKVETNTSNITIKATEVSGEASLLSSRSKSNKIGFNLNIEGTIKGEDCDKAIDAKFEIKQIDENNVREDEYEIEISNTSSALETKLKTACRPPIQKAFEAFSQAMREQSS